MKCLFDCKNICQRIGVKGTKPFPPETANMAAWFRYGQGITSAAGLVSQWDDQSGNGRHLKQATGTNQPALQSDGSILFDGVDNYLKCDAFTLNQPATIYGLLRQVTWTLNDAVWDGDSGARVFQSPATPQLRLNAGASVTESGGLAVNTYGIVAAVYNGASSVLQINNGTAATGDAGAGNLAGYTLGANGAGGGPSNIQAKEVIVYAAAHSSDQRAAIISYLARVGGLSL